MPGGPTAATAAPITSLPYSDSDAMMTVSVAGANAAANAVGALLNGGTLRIYSGTQPATADTAITTQVLLASPTFGSPAFASASAGTATANAITADTNASASGTARWFRAVTSGGTVVYDGNVGTTSLNQCRLASTTITAHGTVAVTSAFYVSPALGRERWYVYTPAASDPNAISVFPYAATLATQLLRVWSPDAVTAYPNDLPQIVNSKPLQVMTEPGVSYYLTLYNQAGAYTLSVEAGPADYAPVGSILVPNDIPDYPAAVLSATDGTVRRFVDPFPAGETADVIPSGTGLGRILAHSRNYYGGSPNHYIGGTGNLQLYSPQFDLLADLPYIPHADSYTAPIRWGRTSQQFYVGQQTDPLHANASSVTTVTAAGAFGATTWVLTGHVLGAGLAPSVDETVLYTIRSTTGTTLIGRWDLVNDVGLSNLTTAVASFGIQDLLVLGDDTILAAYVRTVTNVTPFVRRYDAAGTTLNTYTLTGSQSTEVRLATALDDPTSVWVWSRTNATETLSGVTTLNKFTNLRVSDGAILLTFSVPQFIQGADQEAKSATPSARFGAAESCPFLILREVVPVITGTIDLTAPAPSALALTGYPLPPRHPESRCFGGR